jgi:hypothetical protein
MPKDVGQMAGLFHLDDALMEICQQRDIGADLDAPVGIVEGDLREHLRLLCCTSEMFASR